MRNYLITGISGSGKTAVGKELMERGYMVCQADDALVVPGTPGWNWDRDRLADWLRRPGFVFVCGGADNQDVLTSLFRKVFVLRVADAVATRRLQGRASGPASPSHRQIANAANVQFIDANRGIRAVVFDILRAIGS
jgi:hypothetical protein